MMSTVYIFLRIIYLLLQHRRIVIIGYCCLLQGKAM